MSARRRKIGKTLLECGEMGHPQCHSLTHSRQRYLLHNVSHSSEIGNYWRVMMWIVPWPKRRILEIRQSLNQSRQENWKKVLKIASTIISITAIVPKLNGVEVGAIYGCFHYLATDNRLLFRERSSTDKLAQILHYPALIPDWLHWSIAPDVVCSARETGVPSDQCSVDSLLVPLVT